MSTRTKSLRILHMRGDFYYTVISTSSKKPLSLYDKLVRLVTPDKPFARCRNLQTILAKGKIPIFHKTEWHYTQHHDRHQRSRNSNPCFGLFLITPLESHCHILFFANLSLQLNNLSPKWDTLSRNASANLSPNNSKACQKAGRQTLHHDLEIPLCW